MCNCGNSAPKKIKFNSNKRNLDNLKHKKTIVKINKKSYVTKK